MLRVLPHSLLEVTVPDKLVGASLVPPDIFYTRLPLTWDNWYRSPGCQDLMDSRSWGQISFTTIFYAGMARVFFNPDGIAGVAYTGEVFAKSKDVVAQNNGKRFEFNEESQKLALDSPVYLFNGPRNGPGGPARYTKLRFEGPDPGFPNARGSADTPGVRICIYPDNIINNVAAGRFPNNAVGAEMLAWYVGAVVLHETKHSEGYDHPGTPDLTPGSDYASSMPVVAKHAVLRASPFWTSNFQTNYPVIGLTEGSGVSPPGPPQSNRPSSEELQKWNDFEDMLKKAKYR